MATFDQLSAEQRAIVELVLKQGRSYDQLADMLALPITRVRELARDALVRLSPVSAAAVDDQWRGQLADYLLNQQSGPEATATRGHLRRSESARGWARSVLDSLEQFYDPANVPTVPEGEAGAEPRKERAPRVKRRPEGGAEALTPGARAVVRRRRLIAAALAAAVVIALVVLVWPIGVLTGDDDSSSCASSGGSSTTASDQQVTEVGRLTLNPVESLEGQRNVQGVAAVVQRGDARTLVVQAQLPRNDRGEAYQVWLYNSDDEAVSLGAQVADQQGVFQGAGQLPDNYEDYRFIDISREPIEGPAAHSGNSVLRGELSQLVPPSEAEGDGGAGTAPAPPATSPATPPETAPAPEPETTP